MIDVAVWWPCPGTGARRAAYGPEKYHRLAAIKAVYDPENLFHLNPKIKPARPMTPA
jgi:FAD/FMN-containing dehydrogenase